jgi:H+/Cl- antiporter ClcA
MDVTKQKFQNIMQKLKHIFDGIRNEKLKQNLLQAIPFWAASILTGLFAILYAQAFSMAERITSSIFHYKAWLLFILSPVCFISSWWIVQKFAPYSRGSGVPQVMAAIELETPQKNSKVNKLLSVNIMVVKVLSSIIFVIGGGVIGREGPTIQIAGSVFRKINQILPKWWPKNSKRNMIMTGAAAGLAAAFNAPLGGIMFAIEELTETHLGFFKTSVLSGVIIAGLVAQSIEGPYLYLGFPLVNNLSKYVLLDVALVAIIAGLMGSGMSKVILRVLKWKANFKFNYQSILYLLGCSLILALLAVFINESVLGSGKELLTTSLFTPNKYSIWYIPLLRIAGPILSFTTGASGGIFAPGLSAGGSIGSVVSGWMSLSSTDTNLMILSGMVAFLTGITRTPFTAAILVLEMTDGHSLILQLMMAGVLANLVSMVVDKHSLYHYLKNQYVADLQTEEDTANGVLPFNTSNDKI